MKFLLYLSQNYSFEILRPLAQVMLDEGHDVRWFVEGNEVDKTQFQPSEKVLGSVSAVVEYNPDASFLPGNIVPSFIPGLKVQLFHGFEWKKKGHFRIRGCFDLYCTQGPFFTDRFLALREAHPHFSVKETGWTKLDKLFNEINNGERSEKQHILYAPTFSPSLTSAHALFDEIVTLSKTRPWIWKVKFHPKMDKAIIEQYKQAQHPNLQVIEDHSILPLLRECDVMVSDTSSAITEFLLLNKPVVTFNNSQPEPVLLDIQSAKELGDAVEKGLANDADLMKSIEEYSANMHPFTDGLSAKRVLDATIDEIHSFPNPANVEKPKNFFRNFKLRRRLKYWTL